MRELIAQVDNGAGSARAWITAGPVRCYMRITQRYLQEHLTPTIDLASFEVSERNQGKGHFTRWLTDVEKTAVDTGRVVFIECVLNPKLEQFLLRRGYVACGAAVGGESYYLPL